MLTPAFLPIRAGGVKTAASQTNDAARFLHEQICYMVYDAGKDKCIAHIEQ